MTVSRIFLYFCLSFIGGIFLSSFFNFSRLILLGFLISAILLISVLWERKKLVAAGFCILFLVLGVFRHQSAESEIINNELSKYNDTEQDIVLTGIVAAEPDIREKSIKLTVSVEKLAEAGSPPTKGRVLVTAGRYPEYQYGNKLKITGELKSPSEDIGGFNYRNYLKKDGIYSVMDWPKTELVGSGFGNPVMKIIFSFKNKFKTAVRNFISPPQLGILEALVFGDEEKISKEWKDKLNFTGTRHITAVSGMNITIIGFLILSFALSFGLWRQQAFYLSIFLLLLYILMIGAPASALRAGIMAAILMAAQYFGRLNTALRAVVFAAVLMLLINPLLLKLDVGFQLSFLAILGLVFLQPLFYGWLKKIPDLRIFPVKTALSATLSAQIFTLPILIYNFGYFSLLSPITNILIIPLLAPVTILIFIFALSAMIFWPLGFLLSLPTWLLLTYVVNVVDYFSKLPFVSLTIENLHWIWLIIFYLILGVITRRLQGKFTRPSFLR